MSLSARRERGAVVGFVDGSLRITVGEIAEGALVICVIFTVEQAVSLGSGSQARCSRAPSLGSSTGPARGEYLEVTNFLSRFNMHKYYVDKGFEQVYSK